MPGYAWLGMAGYGWTPRKHMYEHPKTKQPKQFTIQTLPHKKDPQSMYVKPDSLDKTHANYTYMERCTSKHATFFESPIPRNHDVYRRVSVFRKQTAFESTHRCGY